ncbi:hypothetical protein JXR93_06720, partial [bacterium]|nr:hypothetical protein [bacterium]
KINLEKINYYIKNIGINVTFNDIELILFLFNALEIKNIDNIYICENGKNDVHISYLRKIVWESITENKKIQIQGNKKIVDILISFEFVKRDYENENFVKLNYDNFLVKEIIQYYLSDLFEQKSFIFIGKILFFDSSAEIIENYLININEDKFKSIVSNFLSMYDNQKIYHIAVLERFFYTMGKRILKNNEIDNSFEDYKKIIYHQIDCLIQYNKDIYYGQLTIANYRRYVFDFIIICWAINYIFQDLKVNENLKYQFPLNFENNDIKLEGLNANYIYLLKIDKITNQIIEYIVKKSFINATCKEGLISFELAIINNDFSKITEIDDFWRYFEKKYDYLDEYQRDNIYKYLKDALIQKKIYLDSISKFHLKRIFELTKQDDWDKIEIYKHNLKKYKDILPPNMFNFIFKKILKNNHYLLKEYSSQLDKNLKFEIFKEISENYNKQNEFYFHEVVREFPFDCIDFIKSSEFSDIEDFLIDFVFPWILDEFIHLLKHIEINIKNIKRKSDLAAKLKRRLPSSGEYATNIFNVIQKLEK